MTIFNSIRLNRAQFDFIEVMKCNFVVGKREIK